MARSHFFEVLLTLGYRLMKRNVLSATSVDFGLCSIIIVPLSLSLSSVQQHQFQNLGWKDQQNGTTSTQKHLLLTILASTQLHLPIPNP